MSSNKTTPWHYFASVGKTFKGAETIPSGSTSYVEKSLSCDENESIQIPKDAVILAAYYGCYKKYNKGSDVTKKVVQYLRNKNFYTIYANTEWFGDPWYGTHKELWIKVAVPDTSTTTSSNQGGGPNMNVGTTSGGPNVNVRTTNGGPNGGAASSSNTATMSAYPPASKTPAYPPATKTPVYPPATTHHYPPATTGGAHVVPTPAYPTGGAHVTPTPAYPTGGAHVVPTPAYPTGGAHVTPTPAYPTGGAHVVPTPAYPMGGAHVVPTPAYPTGGAHVVPTPAYPTGGVHVVPTPAYPTGGAHVVPSPVYPPATHHAPTSNHGGRWQYEDGSHGSNNWRDFAPADAAALSQALSRGMTQCHLMNGHGSFQVTLGCVGTQKNRQTGTKREMRFAVLPGAAQGAGMWEFKDGNTWKKYIRADATTLSTARANRNRSLTLQNKWGTYEVEYTIAGTQTNDRTHRQRRVRFVDNTSSMTAAPSIGGGSSGAGGKWQFEDGPSSGGQWRDYLPNDDLAIKRAHAARRPSVTISNRFGTYEITFQGASGGTQMNKKTKGKRRVRFLPYPKTGGGLYRMVMGGGHGQVQSGW